MRILYGVVGEGMGHATRSRVLLEHLLARGHDVLVVVSGRAHKFLRDRFAGRERIRIEEIHGLHLRFDGNEIDLAESVLSNLDDAPAGLKKNIEVYRAVDETFDASCVISDFESWAYFYGRARGLPVISVDNMQVINRCAHDDFVTDHRSLAFHMAKLAVKAKLPGAYHYLIASFFFPPVRKPKTTLVPPILRPEILAANREPGSHVLVYQTAASNQDLVPTLRKLPSEFRVYGMGREGVEGNVTLKAFSETGFIDDLRTARAVIAGGGFSLMCEAVHLHVPMLSVPIEGQYEQELNARYLQQLGYGAFARALDVDGVAAFLDDVPRMQRALQGYVRRGPEMLFTCVDELLVDVARGAPPKARLQTAALGAFDDDEAADGREQPA